MSAATEHDKEVTPTIRPLVPSRKTARIGRRLPTVVGR